MMFNQVDRVVLSKMVSLENFGYYNLAGIAAGAIYRLVLPIFTALFPLFSSLLAANDLKRLTQSYHRGCELASVLIWPATAVGVLFSRPILLAWTRNAATADATRRRLLRKTSESRMLKGINAVGCGTLDVDPLFRSIVRL